MAENRQYDHEYKVQAVKLAKEIGQAKAAKELLWSSVFVTLMAKKYRFMQFELDMVFDTH